MLLRTHGERKKKARPTGRADGNGMQKSTAARLWRASRPWCQKPYGTQPGSARSLMTVTTSSITCMKPPPT